CSHASIIARGPPKPGTARFSGALLLAQRALQRLAGRSSVERLAQRAVSRLNLWMARSASSSGPPAVVSGPPFVVVLAQRATPSHRDALRVRPALPFRKKRRDPSHDHVRGPGLGGLAV